MRAPARPGLFTGVTRIASEQALEGVELAGVQIGDRPVGEALARPGHECVALAHYDAPRAMVASAIGPDEDVDAMLPAPVYEHTDAPVADVIEPGSEQH